MADPESDPRLRATGRWFGRLPAGDAIVGIEAIDRRVFVATAGAVYRIEGGGFRLFAGGPVLTRPYEQNVAAQMGAD